MKGFKKFLSDFSFLELVIGFMLAAAAGKVVSSLVDNIITPLFETYISPLKNLENATMYIGSAKITYGVFLNDLVNFIIVAVILYLLIILFGIKRKKINN
jgi:large conductance mechanosensitive channel